MGTITIAMIVVMLLSIMLVVVKGFASKTATQESIKEIINDLTPNQMLAEYKRQLSTLKMCALGGGLLTMMYAMQFFSGGELDPRTWEFGQWIAVSVGAVVVFAITATQYNLYQDVSGAKTAVFIIIGILFFVFISEIASTSERESELVKSRSMDSPAMKAALSAIGSNTNSIQSSSGYEDVTARAQGIKATHEIELARCKRHASKGAKRVERCRVYETKKIVEQQAIIDQYSKSSSNRQNAITGNTQALIDKVQILQQDESQHAAIIRFFKGFGISSMGAMMFVAFILVNAFELGFHYSGSRVGHLKSALAQIGYDLQDKTNDFDIQKGKMDLLRLRDAAKTKKEVEQLKAKIKELSSSDHVDDSPTPDIESDNVVPLKANTASNNSPSIGFELPDVDKVKFTKKPLDNAGKIVDSVDEKLSTSERQNELDLGGKLNALKYSSGDSKALNQNGSVEGSKNAKCTSAFTKHKAKNKALNSDPVKKHFSDTDLIYPEWEKAVLKDDCKLSQRPMVSWVKKHLGVRTSKQVKKVTDTYAGVIMELLYKRGLGNKVIKLNPKWKGAGRIPKYILA